MAATKPVKKVTKKRDIGDFQQAMLSKTKMLGGADKSAVGTSKPTTSVSATKNTSIEKMSLDPKLLQELSEVAMELNINKEEALHNAVELFVGLKEFWKK